MYSVHFVMNIEIVEKEIRLANARIRNHILFTPLIHSTYLSKICDCRVLLKLESEQYTGSFKARGSLNKLMSLNETERASGAVTASTGNHGLGFARAASITGISGTVYLPKSASRAKMEALSDYPVDLQLVDGTSLDTEVFAKKKADEASKIWVSPYNDLQVMAGQGTVGIEILQQDSQVDHILVTVGGGGLVGGIGAYVKVNQPEIQIHSCQPINSPEMTISLEKGVITGLDKATPTLSDGSAGGIEEGSITFPVCQRVIDHSILVQEAEIEKAISIMVYHHHKIVEGAAGVAIAALIQQKERFKGSTVVIVICGANISIETLKTLL